MFRVFAIILLGIFSISYAFAQVNEENTKEVLYKRETSSFLSANSNGVGFGYRSGKFKTGYKLRTLEFSFCNIRDLKQVKTISNNPGAKSYFYGKLIYFYSARVLYGMQNTVTTKPYWGGTEIRTLFLGGANFGIGKPIYLYVIQADRSVLPILEKYQTDKFLQQDIYGKGPFSKGLSELQFYPGLSLKAALNVEFGIESESVRAFETGFIVDAFIKPVQIMSFSPKKQFIFSLYLSYYFGKRFNP
jgi:hypothetical protein